MIDINKNLETWEKIFQSHEWGKYPSIPVIRFMARNFYSVKNRKEIKILEIGSGTGANLWYCAREGFSVIALEGSQTGIERMKKRFEAENLTPYLLDVKQGDYYYTLDEIEDSSIDGIIDSESLSCNPFDRAREIIVKCFKKLKLNGLMLSITFAEGTWGLEGEECDYHATYPTVGPLANKGFTRYTTYDDINKLYKLHNNVIERIERQEYYYIEQHAVKQWVIEVRRIS